jgi:hypothetical protein
MNSSSNIRKVKDASYLILLSFTTKYFVLLQG